MNAKVLMVGAIVLILLGGAAYWMLGYRPVAAPVAPARPPSASESTGNSSQSPIDAAPSTSGSSQAATAAAAFAPRAAPGNDTGAGRIFGKVEPAEGDALPDGTVVSIHRIDMTAEVIEYTDTLVADVEPDAGKQFNFPELPLGRYVIYANAPGYTIQSTAHLTPQRRERELTLRLVPGGVIAGRVVNEAREPVPGAHVFTAAWDIAGQQRDGPRDRVLSSRVETGPDGRFVMENVRQSLNGEPGYKLAVKAEGYATYLSDYIPAGREDVEFVLTRGGVVVGRLTHYQTGDPAPNLQLRVESDLAIERLVTRSDVEGWFFLDGVPAGAHALDLVDKEMVVVPETARFNVVEGGSTDDLAVQVAPGGKLSGRVYDAETGNGVSGAQVFVHRTDPRGELEPATTDAQGVYSVAGLKPGTYELRLEKVEGYPEMRREEDSVRMTSAAIASDTTGIDFALRRGIVVSGHVVDEDGRPVAQATVNARADRTNNYDYSRTDDRGAFSVAGFEPNQTVFVDAGKAEYALLDADPDGGKVQIEDGNLSVVRLVLGTPASISGRVVDKLNRPKSGIQMYARSPSQLNRGSPIERSAADGSITFDRLSPGEYKLVFSDLPHQFAQDQAQTVTVKKGERVTDLKIVYPEMDGLTITGRVTDSNGQPIRASIQVRGPTWQDVTADANGEYTLGGLQDVQYTIFAASSQHSSSEPVTVAAGSRNVNFVLKGLAIIEGRVVSRGTGEPVEAFRVRVQSEQQNRYYIRDYWATVRDAQGRFRIAEVEEGEVSIQVIPEGFAETMQPIGFARGGETTEVTIRVENGATLAGRVLDAQGNAVSAAQLFVGEAPGDDWRRDRERRAMSGPDGSYELTSLPSGNVQIAVHHASFAPTTKSLHVAPAVVNRADIVMSAGGTLTGLVTLDGKPMPGQTVHASMQNGGGHRTIETDPTGRYELTGLSDGQLHINPTVQGDNIPFQGKSAQVEVAEGLVTEMDFHFRSGTSTVEGTVYQARNDPAGAGVSININIQNPDGTSDYKHAQTDTSGRYLLENVPAGQARLNVYAQGMSNKSITLEVGERQRIQRDIELFGGGTIRVNVSGGRADTMQSVTLLAGNVQIPEMSMQGFSSIQSSVVSSAGAQGGLAVMSNIEPGTYTVLVFQPDPVSAQTGDPFTNARFGTATVTLPRDGDVTASVSLN